ncbi:MAG: ATP-binding protein [candidate division WOR-3 bacterium]|nr:ATP-binding protein [candidate division WOR-3 bacterium]
MKSIKEIVVLSGKGGTGKTTITASLAKLMNDKVIVDSDVDAADMFILLDPEIMESNEFKGKSVAVIDQDKCTGCNRCRELCNFNAVEMKDNKYSVNEFMCDGCNLCAIECPVQAIDMEEQIVGEWYRSKTDFGTMIHAKLKPGAENSGNLVTMVKHQARRNAEDNSINHILIDGPPGIGCPVTSSLSGADFTIIVTEPSLSGVHDLERIYSLADSFNVSAGIVINKFDINPRLTDKIIWYAEDKHIPVIGIIPFDDCIVNALMNKETPVERSDCGHIKEIIKKIHQYAISEIGE